MGSSARVLSDHAAMAPKWQRARVLKRDAFKLESIALRLSCPAKAGHPVITDSLEVTGSPAFAGDDRREATNPTRKHHALGDLTRAAQQHQGGPFPRSVSGTCLSSALLTNSTESIAAPSWVRNCSIASFIGGGRSPHQLIA